ncbi:minor tail protein [Gordonia phage Commandaria]|uniref:Minor tail protein n=1 Tax=Gordonia phage Commandaria TaxID=3038364 RepID=A0AAF0GG91_9CAUD|nr:minor tail protein [Gordonia phage Commandaria]WGH20806.1 minor tail protein [Gordonia phage Commandaria]
MATNFGTVFPTRSAAEWRSLNPLLKEGQGAYEADTGALKIGDGTNVYADLPYFIGAVAELSDAQIEGLGLVTEEEAGTRYAPKTGGTYFVGDHGLKGDWVGGPGGSGTNDTAALMAGIASVPDGSKIVFDKTKTYRLDPMSLVGKDIELDFNGCTVVTKTMDASNLAAAQPFLSWSSEVGDELSMATAGANRGDTYITMNPFSAANQLSPGDYVLLRDRFPVANWQTGTNMAWVGVGEVAQVASVVASTGRVNLRSPLRHRYRSNGGSVPKVRRVIKPVSPKVRNLGKIMDTNPGGAYTGDVETGGAHLFYFYGCIEPEVHHVKADGFQNHVVNFNSCLRPYLYRGEGRNPFQVSSGHGYVCRFVHCVDGLAERLRGYGVRHVANYVGSVNCGTAWSWSFHPAGVSFQTHGLQSRDSFSIDDSVVGGDSSGWSHGNPQFGPDYGFRVVRPHYYGIQRGVLARSLSEGTFVIEPDIHTTLKGIEVSGGAKDTVVDLTSGLIEIFGSDAGSYAVHAADVDAAGTAFKPDGIAVIGKGRLIGPRAVVELDATNVAPGDVTIDTAQMITGDKTLGNVGFFGKAALAARPAATLELGTVLSDLGLREAGGAYQIITSGAVAFTGGLRFGSNVRTANTTLSAGNAPVNLCNADAGAITMTLFNTGTAGYRFLFKRTSGGSNNVTVQAGSGGSIDGQPSIVLDAQYKWVEVISSTTVGAWFVIGRG